MTFDQIEQAGIGRDDIQIIWTVRDDTDTSWYEGCSLGLAKDALRERRGTGHKTRIVVSFFDADGKRLPRPEGERRLTVGADR